MQYEKWVKKTPSGYQRKSCLYRQWKKCLPPMPCACSSTHFDGEWIQTWLVHPAQWWKISVCWWRMEIMMLWSSSLPPLKISGCCRRQTWSSRWNLPACPKISGQNSATVVKSSCFSKWCYSFWPWLVSFNNCRACMTTCSWLAKTINPLHQLQPPLWVQVAILWNRGISSPAET